MYTEQTSLIFAAENQPSYPAVSPVNPYLQQVKDKETKMKDGCGMNFTALSQSVSRLGLLQKMYLDLLPSRNTPELSMTWKQKVTQSKHLYYQLQTTARRISEEEHLLLPTPRATDWKRSVVAPAELRRKSPGIPVYAAMMQEGIFYLPTPCTSQLHKIIRPLIPSEKRGGMELC